MTRGSLTLAAARLKDGVDTALVGTKEGNLQALQKIQDALRP
jgi:hypothetical protein